MTDALVPSLGQQLLNNPFRAFVFALAELVMSNMSLWIDEIQGRPIFVVEGAPYRMVAIDRDRISHSHVLHRPADMVNVFLESKLGRVHANHHQSLILVLLSPCAHIGQLA